MVHLPTGITVHCQDEKSQHKNRAKAMRILKSRLYDFYESKKRAERESARNVQIGTGDRSDRIRTYNFPQNRVTDHRANLTLYNLENVMLGELDELIDVLVTRHNEKRLVEMLA
jgi:peptide chain release factor 1